MFGVWYEPTMEALQPPVKKIGFQTPLVVLKLMGPVAVNVTWPATGVNVAVVRVSVAAALATPKLARTIAADAARVVTSESFFNLFS